MIGWNEIAAATLHPTSIVQHWQPKVPPAGGSEGRPPDPVDREQDVPGSEIRQRRRRWV
jgi:hypothetical protein